MTAAYSRVILPSMSCREVGGAREPGGWRGFAACRQPQPAAAHGRHVARRPPSGLGLERDAAGAGRGDVRATLTQSRARRKGGARGRCPGALGCCCPARVRMCHASMCCRCGSNTVPRHTHLPLAHAQARVHAKGLAQAVQGRQLAVRPPLDAHFAQAALQLAVGHAQRPCRVFARQVEHLSSAGCRADRRRGIGGRVCASLLRAGGGPVLALGRNRACRALRVLPANWPPGHALPAAHFPLPTLLRQRQTAHRRQSSSRHCCARHVGPSCGWPPHARLQHAMSVCACVYNHVCVRARLTVRSRCMHRPAPCASSSGPPKSSPPESSSPLSSLSDPAPRLAAARLTMLLLFRLCFLACLLRAPQRPTDRPRSAACERSCCCWVCCCCLRAPASAVLLRVCTAAGRVAPGGHQPVPHTRGGRSVGAVCVPCSALARRRKARPSSARLREAGVADKPREHRGRPGARSEGGQ